MLSTDHAVLYERIDALIAIPTADEPAHLLARLERTLTDGYAAALALEAERYRVERRIGEVASELHDGNKELKSEELAHLSRRLATTGVELTVLRERLAALRDRTAAVKAA